MANANVLNPKVVARKVSERIRQGKKIVMGEIIRDSGYAVSTSLRPSQITESKAYQSEIAPFVTRMERLRDKILAEMDKKDLNKEQFTNLSNSLRNLTHDIQLTRGKATENVAINDYRNLTNEELDKLLETEPNSGESVKGESKEKST